MTREELLRILDFVDTTRGMTEKSAGLSAVDPRWNLISFAVRRHYEGKLITSASMAMAADVPYGTAMRRVNELIEEDLLLKRVKSKTGKSFSLHPTKKLIKNFESYAQQLKAHIGKTFGFTSDGNSDGDFYFGGSYMASRILSFPSVMKNGIGYEHVLRILTPSDPTFTTLSDFSKNLDTFSGGRLEIINLPLDELHDEITLNAKAATSKYDIVAIDLPWLGEFADQKIVMPLTEIIEREKYPFSDFHHTAWKASSYNDDHYALPIQPTAELLFYRTDLFKEAGLAAPDSTDDILQSAMKLHKSKPDLNGIVMNYGPGTPIAHTFIQTLADFGQPIINLPKIESDFDLSHLKGEHFRPCIDSEAGHMAAEFMLALLAYAHPVSVSCNWDKRIKLFSEGKAAMTYGWSIRASVFELNPECAAHGNVDFVSHPSGNGHKKVSPIGGFSLAIPSNLNEDRVQNAWKMMEYLARPELMKWYVQNGNLSSPRFSTSSDPEVKALSKIIKQVDVMENRGELQLWPRPPIAEFNDIVHILGEEIHSLIRGESTISSALNESQSRVDKLMRSRGRY
jgi:multiple sugar transport system substrate-binding protein